MTTLQNGSRLKNIPLNEISEGDNVRTSYANIDELAASIERHGQLQPVGVYKDDGASPWRILYGHRRLRAFQLLVEQGKAEFASISAVIVERPASLEVVQLIENIHRDDLSDVDKEKAVRGMVDRGMSQRDVARVLNKSETWVSRCLSAMGARESVEHVPGVENMTTAALAEVATLPADKRAEVVEKLAQNGSATVKEAREAVRAVKAGGGLPTVESSNAKWSAEALAGEVKPSSARPLSERVMYVCGRWREKASEMASVGELDKSATILILCNEIEREVNRER